MAYQMAQLPIILSEAEDHFCCNDLECPWRLFPYCKPFQVWHFIFVACLMVPVHLRRFLWP